MSFAWTVAFPLNLSIATDLTVSLQKGCAIDVVDGENKVERFLGRRL
jgi:hypothetical protein